ncbi:MAG: hypothetical protein VX669_08185, partial [Planctomycetota bacterium]|nr:hypothetical protein [Planctomycetota bacterium]
TNDGAMTFVFVILLHLTNVLVALRFGLLALMTAHFVQELLVKFPITSGLSEWYAGSGLVGLGSALGLALIAIYISLGGQSLFDDTPRDKAAFPTLTGQ